MKTIKEMLAPLGSDCRSGYKRDGMIGVTIHETGNSSSGAGALNHALYLQNTGQHDAVSWHYAVDDSLITRSIPESEIAWHAGDGRYGNGNSDTISIEICVNPDSNYEQAKINAAELAADILVRHGFDNADAALFLHRDWSGKNCPTRIISSGTWPAFNAMVQKFIDGTSSSGSSNNPDFDVYEDISGHLTANDAIKGINKKTVVKQGKYYIFKEVEDAVNVTKTKGVPGSWINSHENTIARLGEIKAGETVTLRGYVYADSYGTGKSKTHYNRTGKITIITDLKRDYPYHFETLGWVCPDSIEKLSSDPPVPPVTPGKVFKVGDTVKILSSANTYSRSTVKISSIYKNKPYTIQQVGDDDVLIKELYSWVKKTDVEFVSSVPSSTIFRVGDTVKILSSATTYSRSTVIISSIYKNKPYTIQQVGDDDVLIKELYSWVKKKDVVKS